MSFLARKKKNKVQFSPESIIKCRCAVCPVQFRSICAGPKRMTRNKILEAVSPEMFQSLTKEQVALILPKVDDMPGPYCANGVASCKDLNFSKMCLCNDCQLFKDFNLMTGKPTSYFCKYGKAK